MQEVMGNDDVNLQIGGTRVNRMQFNAVYKDIMACLYKARVEAGVKLEVRNFKKEVWADEYDIFNPCDGAILSQLFIGWLHQKERVSAFAADVPVPIIDQFIDFIGHDQMLQTVSEF